MFHRGCFPRKGIQTRSGRWGMQAEVEHLLALGRRAWIPFDPEGNIPQGGCVYNSHMSDYVAEKYGSARSGQERVGQGRGRSMEAFRPRFPRDPMQEASSYPEVCVCGNIKD